MKSEDDSTEVMRLQRFLALAGVASRRSAEDLIRAGRVTIDKKRAELGAKVSLDSVVAVDGQRVHAADRRVVLIANKPVGMVTTMHDPEERPTIARLIPRGIHLHPVGRLDYDTGGLLLLTNDGALTHILTHPSFGVEKTYRVTVRGRLTPESMSALQNGVRLDDGPTNPAKVRVVSSRREESTIDLSIHEGRNRQVRRMLEELGNPVQSLTRLVFGPFKLGSMNSGEVREPTDAEWVAIERIMESASEEEIDG